MKTIEKWDVFETEYNGKTEGNPFVDYEIRATFSYSDKRIEVGGFYDGDGIYKIRFMPEEAGLYEYVVTGSALGDKTYKGTLEVTENTGNNHGPVRVRNKQALCYADGEPYHSIGTTCYAWVNQSEDMQNKTLETLKNSCFNKIRFCIFPKFYQYNKKEPLTYPYIRGNKRGLDPDKTNEEKSIIKEAGVENIRDFDLFSFNVEHFRRFDKRIRQLMDMGIEADIILFHPYDKWGFSTMSRECNELYLKYMAHRYSAYRNVWWSMANEYDILNNTGWTNEEWSDYGRLITSEDPYGHLCSIHNCIPFFDYSEEWITHCSMQRQDLYKHVELTDEYIWKYSKPVVWDEVAYEGNIDQGWGNITPEEMVRRFWEATIRGGACGHGETYVHPEDILWWSHGGELHGESEPRLRFLKKIWDETPGGTLKRGGGSYDFIVGIPFEEEKECTWTYQTWASYEIHYYGFGRPSYREFNLPEDNEFEIDVIDTWNMTIKNTGRHKGFTRIELPAHQWMAIRIRKVLK